MALTNDDLDEIFKYHPAKAMQQAAYEALREKGRELAECILKHCPPGPDQTAAIRKVREAVMTANAAVALGGKY